MTFFMIKSLLGIAFFIFALIAFFSMLTLMGKTEKKMKPQNLRLIHKTAGFIFLLLLLILSFFCIKYWIMAGDQVSPRAAAHAVLSLSLLVLFLMKITIAQFYKQFLKFMPALGMIVFSLAFVITGLSSGYYLLRSGAGIPQAADIEISEGTDLSGNASKGQAIFSNRCSFCHYSDKEESLSGPGLKNIFKKENLPHSGRPATMDNVKAQLIKPVLSMPSFTDFSDQELADLLAYLKTL
ncbi:c-type cytochrome [Acidobacteriota bacterium]